MGVIEINRHPSRRDLMVFGLLLAVFTAIVGALMLWRTHEMSAARTVWIAGGTLSAIFFVVPPLRRPIFLGWSYLTFPIGFVISHVILGFVYYVVFTLVGLVMRLVGYDPMHRKMDPAAKSYWIAHDPHTSVERYFRQS
jgi:saxitoxin biosynthesis operon SxtJ-like protein